MSKTKILASAQDVENAFYEALERADLELMMSIWADDEEIVCIHPGGPRLAGIKKLNKAAKNQHFYRSLKTMLVREQNTVVHALREATRIARGMCP